MKHHYIWHRSWMKTEKKYWMRMRMMERRIQLINWTTVLWRCRLLSGGNSVRSHRMHIDAVDCNLSTTGGGISFPLRRIFPILTLTISCFLANERFWEFQQWNGNPAAIRDIYPGIKHSNRLYHRFGRTRIFVMAISSLVLTRQKSHSNIRQFRWSHLEC